MSAKRDKWKQDSSWNPLRRSEQRGVDAQMLREFTTASREGSFGRDGSQEKFSEAAGPSFFGSWSQRVQQSPDLIQTPRKIDAPTAERTPSARRRIVAASPPSRWITVFPVDPRDVVRVLDHLRDYFGPVERHIWPGGSSCNYFYLCFERQIDAQRACMAEGCDIPQLRHVSCAACVSEAPHLDQVAVQAPLFKSSRTPLYSANAHVDGVAKGLLGSNRVLCFPWWLKWSTISMILVLCIAVFFFYAILPKMLSMSANTDTYNVVELGPPLDRSKL